MSLRKKILRIVTTTILISFIAFIVISVFGYSYSKTVNSISEIEELDAIGVLDVLGKDVPDSEIKYRVKKGYVGRGVVSVSFSLKMSKEEYFAFSMNGLPYEKVEEGWWEGRLENDSGNIKSIPDIEQAWDLIQMKKKLPIDTLDGGDFCGVRFFITQRRSIVIESFYDVQNNLAMFFIASCFRGD